MPPRQQSVIPIGPTDFHLFTGLEVPDPISFVVSPEWCDRPQLYPRQATLLKVIFLRNDLLTDYDHQVIDEWESNFRRTGNNGIVPDVRTRMASLRLKGYSYFREVLLVLGRRAGKGYISALAMAYVLWRYLAKGDPQGFYGIDRDKQLACFIYAGKKEQAKVNLYRDLEQVILGAPCFGPYVNRPLGESLSIYAPHDFVRMKKLQTRGINTERDMATFLIQPKEATLMSGRGPASFMQGYDEMAHLVTAGGASRSAEEIYGAATPALDQFKKDAFIIEPSSPWQMIGQFYTNWEHSLALNAQGEPEYPEILMLQLASWEIYYDWDIAHELPLFPEEFEGDLGEYANRPHPHLAVLKGAVQEYDEGMQKLEKANPETFKVERLSHWQATVDAYLDPKKIEAMFDHSLSMNSEAKSLTMFYKGHADPSKVNDNFAVAIAHAEKGEDGLIQCVFDYIHHWKPSDFPENTIDYLYVTDRLFDLIWAFKTDEFTFDQHNSEMPIQSLNRRIREQRAPKRMQVFEKTSTAQHNWARAECFKVSINQGWVTAPYYETADLELRFLQLKATGSTNKVVHQDTGPVVHDDVATAMMECVWTILGEQARTWTHGLLSESPLTPGLQGGFDPYSRELRDEDQQVFSRISGFGANRNTLVRGGGRDPSRNPAAFRSRRYR